MQQGISPDLENTIYTANANKDCCTPWRQALAAGYPYLQKLEIDSLPEEIQAWIYDENGYADLKDSREQMGVQYKSRLQPAEYMTEDGNEYQMMEKQIAFYDPSLDWEKNAYSCSVANKGYFGCDNPNYRTHSDPPRLR